MDLFILDTNLEAISVVDVYKSLIWTERYNKYGDFELYMPMSSDVVKDLKIDRYLQTRDSDHVMIIETIQIDSKSEDGNYLTVTGKSLESILQRRIVWGLKTLSGSLQNGIQELLNENVISPSNENRKIPNFIFEASTDPVITELTIEAQYTGDNLYDVINKICTDKNIGFKVTLNEKNQFVFKLYAGVDRSYDQTERPYVVFSPGFDNLTSGNYIESKAAWKNVTLVGGEGEGTSRRYTAVGNISGLNRREIFTDARDISSDIGDGQTLTNDEYVYLLRQRGKETLSENMDILAFEGEAEMTQMFQYGVDFFHGDVVQVEDEYGHVTKARVTEVVTSENEEGFSRYPTFSTIDSDSLPKGYLKLQYIQSSGTQYIDTALSLPRGFRFVGSVEQVGGDLVNQGIIGAHSDAPEYYRSYLFWTSGKAWNFGAQEAATFGSWQPNVKYDIDACNVSGNIYVKINGVDQNVSAQLDGGNPVRSPHTVSIFALHWPPDYQSKSHMRLYYCKIYDHNSLLVRDFVPCKNDKDVIGLYDYVTGTFFENDGTGAFTT